MRKPTPTFEQGDIVKVPFPFTSRPTRQFRPALVVSVDGASSGLGLLWVVMITSAENRGWPGDIALTELDGTGLPVASVVRTAKIATIETGDAIGLGQVPPDARQQVLARIADRLGLSSCGQRVGARKLTPTNSRNPFGMELGFVPIPNLASSGVKRVISARITRNTAARLRSVGNPSSQTMGSQEVGPRLSAARGVHRGEKVRVARIPCCAER
jgi:mRNA interferase MazF